MATLLLLTNAMSPSADVLPALALLGHTVRVAPLEVSALLSSPQHDAVLGVHKLPAGSWTEYRRDGSSTSRVYWDPV